MILARNLKVPPIPRGKLGRRLMAMANGKSIDTLSEKVPYDATCWIGCREAWPHVDLYEDWAGKVFVTLCIIGNHYVGDAKAVEPRNFVTGGDLFVIDPLVPHWLAPPEPDRNGGFLAVQWEVLREESEGLIQEVIEKHGHC